jgi:hypothetical protein
MPEDACSYWKLAARVNANKCYSCAEGNVCCIYIFVCLTVPVYARVLPVWIVPLPLLAVRPELKQINLASPPFITPKIVILFKTR